MGRTQTIRPTFSRVLAALVALCCLLTLGIVLADDGLVASLRLVGPLGVVGLLAWTVLWRPLVEVSDGGVLLVNPLRTVHVPWPALDEVGTRWALTLRTADGTVFSAFAATAPGAMGRSGAGLSVEAAALIDLRRAQLAEAGYLDDVRPEGAPVRVHLHSRTLAALCALAAVSVATVLLAP